VKVKSCLSALVKEANETLGIHPS